MDSTMTNSTVSSGPIIEEGSSGPLSVSKTINSLLSIPTNRKCADCRTQLVDRSQTFASFTPLETTMRTKMQVDEAIEESYQDPPRRGIPKFQVNHANFAPDRISLQEFEESQAKQEEFEDPIARVAQYSGGGHAVFVCVMCSKAHLALGEDLTTVKGVNDTKAWTTEEVQFYLDHGGNAKSWKVYEAYVPDHWKRNRPKFQSSVSKRLIFCRAKYEALLFLTPQGGPMANRAWITLLDGDRRLQAWNNGDLRSFEKLSLTEKDIGSTKSMDDSDSSAGGTALPNRLVDFFCVIGHSELLYPTEVKKNLYGINSPEELTLRSQILDCYPAPDAYPDMDFPEHVNTFVFPDGCRVSETQHPPKLMTFVLTSANGHRLYGAALTIYDTTMETSRMKDVLDASGYTVPLPWWLTESKEPPKGHTTETMRLPSDIVFLPKCLVVLSHYGFFDLWRKFLMQLYRISITEAPLPIERFVSNFMNEVPLPPQGRVVVKWGFTADDTVSISRPAPNQLPLLNFSYQPLFSSLSVGNVIVVWGCLLQETRVVLCSKYYALLGPVAEAFLSFLFPFQWQGMYIPVMNSSMMEILDAPVPYLVGIHSRYLSEVRAEIRPKGVVFVDLDKDIVHLGWDDSDRSGRVQERLTPDLPDKDAMKLRMKLQESMRNIFLVPPTGIEGMITTGNGELVENVVRQPYAHMTMHTESKGSSDRNMILSSADLAYPDHQMLKPIEGFFSEQGQLTGRVSEIPGTPTSLSKTKLGTSFKRTSKVLQARKDKLMANHGGPFSPAVFAKADGFSNSLTREQQRMMASLMYDVVEPYDLTSDAVRFAFLRFFTTIFNRYDRFITGHGSAGRFRSEAFLNDLSLAPSSRKYISEIMTTQMFQRFLEDRGDRDRNPEVLFFDEQIIAKQNRSKISTFAKGGKERTPFLDDGTWKVSEVFTPAAPSNWGLPDDGRSYHYPHFPHLESGLFGKVRKCKTWPQTNNDIAVKAKLSRRSLNVRQKELRANQMHSSAHVVPTLLTRTSSRNLKGKRNVNWAIKELSNEKSMALDLKRLKSSDYHQNLLSGSDSQSVAQEIMVAARRKQAILLVKIVLLQATVRMYFARRLFEDLTGRHTLQKKRAKREAERKQAAILIQTQALRYVYRIRYQRTRDAFIRCQARCRGRRCRFLFELVIEAVCLLQARCRGVLARRAVVEAVEDRIERYKLQLFWLWQRESSPFAYRSKMWPLFSHKSRFLALRLCEDDLMRVHEKLDITRTASTPGSQRVDKGEQQGMNVRTEKRYQYAKKVITSKQKMSGDKAWFPLESSNEIQMARARLTAERLFIYDQLDNPSRKSSLVKVYKFFGVKAHEKKKKARILEALWADPELGDASSETMLSIFPELESNNDFQSLNPSKKAMKRYSETNIEMQPLDEGMLADYKLEALLRANLSEVAIAGISRIPELTIRINDKMKRRTKSLDRRKAAILVDDESNPFSDRKLELTQAFLAP